VAAVSLLSTFFAFFRCEASSRTPCEFSITATSCFVESALNASSKSFRRLVTCSSSLSVSESSLSEFEAERGAPSSNSSSRGSSSDEGFFFAAFLFFRGIVAEAVRVPCRAAQFPNCSHRNQKP
jgi:hypothetical protein